MNADRCVYLFQNLNLCIRAIRLTWYSYFVYRWSVVKRWPAAIKFEITLLQLSAASPDHCYLAGLDYEMVCGCWSRGALAGGRADGTGGSFNVPGSSPGGGGPGVDIVAGYAESGNLFAARVNRIGASEKVGYEKLGPILPGSFTGGDNGEERE